MDAGRYVIFFMALFSLFTGLIYNEAFSIPLAVFGGSHYKCPGDSSVSLINMRTNEVRPGTNGVHVGRLPPDRQLGQLKWIHGI